jgi:hypothetical protein
MKKIKLTYADIELMQSVLNNLKFDYVMSDNMQKKVEGLYIKLIVMRAQLEYLKAREV